MPFSIIYLSEKIQISNAAKNTENFYFLVVLYEALKPITYFRSYLIKNAMLSHL